MGKRLSAVSLVSLTILFAVTVLITTAGCTRNTPPQGTSVPSGFSTYTDAMKLFSIAYPADWRLTTTLQKEIEQAVLGEFEQSLESNTDEPKSYSLFVTQPPDGGLPAVTVWILPIPSNVTTRTQMLATVTDLIKQALDEYTELSSVETTIGGRSATIIEWEGKASGTEVHMRELHIFEGRRAWGVACNYPMENPSQWDDEFQTIIESFRILN